LALCISLCEQVKSTAFTDSNTGQAGRVSSSVHHSEGSEFDEPRLAPMTEIAEAEKDIRRILLISPRDN